MPKTAQNIRAALALDALGGDLREAIQIAAETGFGSVALGIWHPQINSADFGVTARRDFKRLLKSKNLSLACVRAGIGPDGIFGAKTVDSCITAGLKAIELAVDLGAPWVSLYIGEPTNDSNKVSAISTTLNEPLTQADATGISLAISSGGVDFLGALFKNNPPGHLAANLDTLKILSAGHSIGDALKVLAGHIGIWTCADASGSGPAARPTPLGAGTVPLADIVALLKEQDFAGPIVVDVRSLPNPSQAIARAAKVLSKLLM